MIRVLVREADEPEGIYCGDYDPDQLDLLVETFRRTPTYFNGGRDPDVPDDIVTQWIEVTHANGHHSMAFEIILLFDAKWTAV